MVMASNLVAMASNLKNAPNTSKYSGYRKGS